MRAVGTLFGCLGFLVFFALLIPLIASATGGGYGGDMSYAYGYGVGLQLLFPVLVIALIVGVLGVAMVFASKKSTSASHVPPEAEPEEDPRDHRCPACSALHRFEDLSAGDEYVCSSCGNTVMV